MVTFSGSSHVVDGLHVFYRCALAYARAARSRLFARPLGNGFMASLLARRRLTADGRASACGVAVHLEERQPEVWVDTHVHRVSKRLGLIEPKVNTDKAHNVFARISPPDWIYTLHVDLIRHGRQICHAQRPACEQCTLFSECAYVGSVKLQEEETSIATQLEPS